jgi:hypothetical protein
LFLSESLFIFLFTLTPVPDYVWIPNEYEESGYAKSLIIHNMGLCKPNEIGCTYNNFVVLPEGEEFQPVLPGCNLYTHEVLHLWGFTEQMLHHFFTCGEKSKYTSLPERYSR